MMLDQKPEPIEQECYDAFKAVASKYICEVHPEVMLAILTQLTGSLLFGMGLHPREALSAFQVNLREGYTSASEQAAHIIAEKTRLQ